MTEYLDPDDNSPAIISLENYTFLTHRSSPREAGVFGGPYRAIFEEVF
jgi:hypothetical protein